MAHLNDVSVSSTPIASISELRITRSTGSRPRKRASCRPNPQSPTGRAQYHPESFAGAAFLRSRSIGLSSIAWAASQGQFSSRTPAQSSSLSRIDPCSGFSRPKPATGWRLRHFPAMQTFTVSTTRSGVSSASSSTPSSVAFSRGGRNSSRPSGVDFRTIRSW